MEYVIKVNNTKLFPQSMSVSLSDVDGDSSGVNQKGYMTRDRKRGGNTARRKIELSFPPEYGGDLSPILQAVKDTWFNVTYPDPYTGSERTAQFYVGDRKASLYRFDSIKNQWLWKDVSFNFVEK